MKKHLDHGFNYGLFMTFENVERDILTDTGKISHEIAGEKALTEFEKYRVFQDKLYQSDFDKLIESSNNSQRKENMNKK